MKKEKKMKKLAIALFVALLGFAFTAPAFALENQFGGYWRVRMFHQSDFDGDGDRNGIPGTSTYTLSSTDGATTTYTEVPSTTGSDVQRADTRTRLYYTAVINDNLKFVNKFEMDAVWGDGTYGEIGADGISVEVKNSYVDFNLGMTNWKIGTQGNVIQRGFLFDDDFSGIVFSAADFTFLYAKVDEDGANMGNDAAHYHGKYAFNLGDIKLTPNLTFADQADGDYLYYLGLDLDGAAGGFGYWATFIFNGGEAADDDVEAFLLAAGGNVAISDTVGIHFEGFYASGDDDDADGDIEAFQNPEGASYYWAEIMGLGTFDNQKSNGAPGDKISNIIALNVGVSFKASEKLTIGGDIWYAMLAEDVNGEDELGTEIDLKARYELVEGMNVDLIAAYLFAGDATNGTATDDENPFELGTQFSISF